MTANGGSGKGELERTLGLREAATIGLGTMVGAGIFVFPGLAAGRAGPGAIVSFVIGSAIALLVALPTSELATAMPQSGGGQILVPVRGEPNADRIARFVTAVADEVGASVLLLHAASGRRPG